MPNPHSIKLEMLAEIQVFVSRELGKLYEATKNRDLMMLQELNQALETSDKFIMILRALSAIFDWHARQVR